jgi:hypothetical protein
VDNQQRTIEKPFTLTIDAAELLKASRRDNAQP